VSATAPSGGLTDIMLKARSKIDLANLGISDLRVRKAQNGGLLLEIPGEKSRDKATILASHMREAVGDSANIRVPTKNMELRLRDVDITVQASEVASAISAVGGCAPSEVRVGSFNPGPNGLRTVWVLCPALAACKVAAARGLLIGWSRARAEILPSRPLRCYRCLARGHVQQRCPSNQDRRNLCYRCGTPGHITRACKSKPHCPICIVRVLPSDHAPGSDKCPPVAPKAPPSSRGETGVGGGGGKRAKGKGPLVPDPLSLPLPDNSAGYTPPAVPPPVRSEDPGEADAEVMSVVSEATAEKRARETSGDSPPTKRQA